MLRIAQVEGASPREGFSEVSLTGVTETVIDAYRLDAEEADHELTSTICQNVTVNGDRELLTQALANLVENALRHTPQGTRIDIRLEDDPESGVLLAVEDDGPGVTEVDLPRLTGRFYRGERSRTTPGNGLGLSFVSAVAELHCAKQALVHASRACPVCLAFPVDERWPAHAKHSAVL